MSNASTDGETAIVLREIGAALESVYPKVRRLWPKSMSTRVPG
jgi:hypothetical protein